MNEFNARVSRSVFLGNFIGVVGGAVIYDDDFKIVVGLACNGIEATRKILRCIVNGDND